MVEFGANGGGHSSPNADEALGIAATHESGPGDGALLDADLDVLAAGTKVGRYLVVERLGAGAMGVVYAAYDPKLDRKIALKLLRPQERGGDQARRTARLEREAQAIAKLSHPNVVGIFDVGVHEGQVFMAMEYLAGGTLRDWVAAKKRPWREIVKMFIEVGHGLASAHAEGLIHRDFKPDNVLLDKNDVPKVVDFGLVRLLTAVDLTASGAIERSMASETEPEPVPPPSSAIGAAALTRTGALTGTPAYMAPEQFLGKSVDARTDQFAFCVALYEALYGERPFAGETVIVLAASVTGGRIRPIPKGADVPGWVRACLTQGLRVDPAERYLGFDQLLDTLANDPIARRRRRFLVAAGSISLIAAVVATRHFVLAKRQEIDRQVAQNVESATNSLAEGSTKRAQSKVLRERALAAFDGFEGPSGEDLWAKHLDLVKEAGVAYQRGIQRLEAAAALVPDRGLKVKTADALVDYIRLDALEAAERKAAMRELAPYDDEGTRLRSLTAPGLIKIDTAPEHFEVELEAYDPSTLKVAGSRRLLGRTPIAIDLPPGSYRLLFKGSETRTPFAYPILLAPGEKVEESLRVPQRRSVPNGFVYVPEGRFLFGSDDEEVRATFLETIPLHEVRTGPFVVSKYETTIGEWISFLDDLPPEERELRRPHGRRDAVQGFIDVQRNSEGRWSIRFRATDRTYHAGPGEPFKYDDRTRRISQDWSRFPVSGVSPEDALEYSRWLDKSGRVPGARLCTEREWERVARGADSRKFPHGQSVAPDDANFDITYGRKNGAYGPDEVGSHMASTSPFGVYDLAGNVWEITSSVLDKGQYVARGSSFYQDRRALLSMNRDPISSATRDQTVGLRICADVHD